MISRRLRLVVLAIGAGSLAAPLGAVIAADAAATFNDTVIAEADFVDLLERQADFERRNGTGGQQGIEVAEGMIAGDAARGYLTDLVVEAAMNEFLGSALYTGDGAGDDADDADDADDGDADAVDTTAVAPLADEVLGEVPTTVAADTAPVVEMYTRLNATQTRVLAGGLPADDVLAEVYDDRPATTGVVCAVAATSGDVVCVPLLQAGGLGAEQFDDLRTGVPGDVVAGGAMLAEDDEWTIADFATAAEQFHATVAPFVDQGAIGLIMMSGTLATADIDVDDRWGQWDPQSFAIIP